MGVYKTYQKCRHSLSGRESRKLRLKKHKRLNESQKRLAIFVTRRVPRAAKSLGTKVSDQGQKLYTDQY